MIECTYALHSFVLSVFGSVGCCFSMPPVISVLGDLFLFLSMINRKRTKYPPPIVDSLEV